MWLEVKGGPRDQAGCTEGSITFTYPYRYIDLVGNASIAYYTAKWDPTNNLIKDTITNGAMFILGAGEGEPLPPRIWIIEDLKFSDGTTRRQGFWARPLANETGLEWDYNVPEPGYHVYDGGELQLSLQELAERITALEEGGGGGGTGPQGPAGEDGKSAYEIAVENGFVGTEAAWLASLVGPQGPQGEQGPQGPVGPAGSQAEIPFCFTADGEVIYVSRYAVTLLDVLTEGTGSLTYSKKVGSGGAWSVPGALPVSLAAGDRLKIIATGVSGTFGGNIKGEYT